MAAARKIMASGTYVLSCVDVAKQVVRQYITLNLPESCGRPPTSKGSAYGYGFNVLNLGLLWHGFRDSVHEGDGDHIIRYWRFLLPGFHRSGRKNYTVEAFNLLVQTITLSPRKVAELKWNRTVNSVGREGHNIPCDLHMEHLNRRLKLMTSNLGFNISKPQCIKDISKCLGVVSKICAKFEQETEVGVNKDYHTFPSIQKDLLTILEQLTTDDILVDSSWTLTSYKKPYVSVIEFKETN